MNRVTWIRIGIVVGVVSLGTFAIWKAVSPADTKSKNSAKRTDKTAADDSGASGATPPSKEDNGGGSALFQTSSMSPGRTIPASYSTPTGDPTQTTPQGYPQSGYGSTPENNDAIANRNLFPGDQHSNTAGAQGAGGDERYPANGGGGYSLATSNASDQGNAPGQSSRANPYDAANLATQGYGQTQAGDSNPLRRDMASSTAGSGIDFSTSDEDGAATTGQLNNAGQYASPYQAANTGLGGIGQTTGGLTQQSEQTNASQGYNPYETSRGEPAQLDVSGTSLNGTQSSAGTSGAASTGDYAAGNESSRSYGTGNYGTGQTGATDPLNRSAVQSDTNAGGYLDRALPGGSADALSSRGSAYDDQHRSTVGGYGNYQTDGGLGGDQGTSDQGTSGQGTTAYQNSNAGFDPFDEGGRPGGYASPEYGAMNGMSGAGLAGQGYVDDGVGEPGDESLEGPQSPQVVIQKFAPAEIQVGKAAIFEIAVRNNGDAIAHDVEIHDQVPRGTQLLRSSPQAQTLANGGLVWAVGHLPPGEERIVKMELMPVAEGEIGSVATVRVAASASVRTIATRPDLRVEVAAPQTVMIGEDVTLRIKVRNPGTGVAEGVMITERVPPELRHDAGELLEYEIGQIEPGGTRELELTLTAVKAGHLINALQASGEAGLQALGESRIEVVAPSLQIDVQGPARRYLERPATYTIAVANPGTAAAKNVELVAHVPQGLEFMEADNYGEYDQAKRLVRWSLEELPAAQQGAVNVKLLPMEAGDHRLTAEGSAQKDLFDRAERTLSVEGVAAILFEVVDVNDPIEVGSETTYEIRVLNQGTKVATNIQLEAVLPPEMRPEDGEGPTRAFVEGNRVIFEPLAKLAPRADTKYRIRARGVQPGDLRVTVKLSAAEIAPVIKEESTRVYADQ